MGGGKLLGITRVDVVVRRPVKQKVGRLHGFDLREVVPRALGDKGRRQLHIRRIVHERGHRCERRLGDEHRRRRRYIEGSPLLIGQIDGQARSERPPVKHQPVGIAVQVIAYPDEDGALVRLQACLGRRAGRLPVPARVDHHQVVPERIEVLEARPGRAEVAVLAVEVDEGDVGTASRRRNQDAIQGLPLRRDTNAHLIRDDGVGKIGVAASRRFQRVVEKAIEVEGLAAPQTAGNADGEHDAHGQSRGRCRPGPNTSPAGPLQGAHLHGRHGTHSV